MDSAATNYKISWIRKEDDSRTLDLSPQFQRRPVWTDEQQSYLIDTILSDLPLPEIYVRSMSSPEGKTTYEIIDGQQRIRAILRFGTNDLELMGDDIAARWLNKKFDDLSDVEKTKFWDYKIVARDVSGATDREIRDLFRRLNINSVVLNDQEIRHAKFNGHFIKVMENLADDEWWLNNRIVNLRGVRRMLDVEFVSELFIGLIAGPQDKKKSLDQYYENLDAQMPQKNEWTQDFEIVRDLINDIFDYDDLVKWSGKSDFYTLFLACKILMKEKLTLKHKKTILNALMKFREKVDQAKRKDNKKKFHRDVHDYAEAVTRAATDLGRREIRLRILEKTIRIALDNP